MSTPRSFVWLFVAMLVGAACSPSAEDAATSCLSSSTTRVGVTVPDATEVPPGTESSTSTAHISTPSVTPSYLIYGSVEHNGFAESCGPCRLDARLSPEGALLAYSLWPTAFANQPEPSDGDYDRAYSRDWMVLAWTPAAIRNATCVCV